MIKEFLNLIFPNLCYACENPLLAGEKMICTDCLVSLPKANLGFSRSTSMEKRFLGKVQIKAIYGFYKFVKGGKVQNILHQIKYKQQKELGLFMGELFANSLIENDEIKMLDLIIPVPLFYKKKLARGYNQSEIIANGFVQKLNIKVNTDTLKREKATETQTKKSILERYINVESVFVVENIHKVKGKKIGLLDDVVTTGATLEACALALINAGAEEVIILAVAVAE